MIHYYLLSAALEIAGCYYFAKKLYWLSIPLLIAFGWSLTLQPYEPAKSYLIYGGIYILSCVAFAAITGYAMTLKDWLGTLLILIAILMML